MSAKPVLLWPKARSEIPPRLDRSDDDFLVVDTNSTYELQKLSKLRHGTPVFDPFPGYGEHYRVFIDHLAASDCRCHISGLEVCRDVLQALKDPLLARSPVEEVVAAIESTANDGKARRPIVLDWSHLNPANVIVLAVLVFAATMTRILLSPNNHWLAALIATFVFILLYVCARANTSKLFSSVGARFNAGKPPVVKHGFLRSSAHE